MVLSRTTRVEGAYSRRITAAALESIAQIIGQKLPDSVQEKQMRLMLLHLKAALRHALEAARSIMEADAKDPATAHRLIRWANQSRDLAQHSMKQTMHSYHAVRELFGPHSMYESESMMAELWAAYIRSRPDVPWALD